MPIPTLWSGRGYFACFLVVLATAVLDDYGLLPFNAAYPIIGFGALGTLLYAANAAGHGKVKAKKVEERMGLTQNESFVRESFAGDRGEFRVRLLLCPGSRSRRSFELLELSAAIPSLRGASFLVIGSWPELPVEAVGRLLLPAPGPKDWPSGWKILSRPRGAAERMLRFCGRLVRHEPEGAFVGAAAHEGRLTLRWRAACFEAEDIEPLMARAREWLSALSQSPGF